MRFDTIRFFLWFHAKDRVYAEKPSTELKHLKTNIRRVMAEILLNMYQKVVENYLKESVLAILRMEVI